MLLPWKWLIPLLIPVLAALGIALFHVIPDWYPVSFVLFVVFVAIVLVKDRAKFERQSVLFLRRTTRGRNVLIWLGTHGRDYWKLAGMAGVGLGFFFSVWMFIILLQLTLQSLFATTAVPGLSLVLPSPTASPIIAPGVFGVPFWFWIISIAVLIIFHEGFHGIFVAREGVKIKSMGVGVLAVLPLAFVEPDEEELQKQPFWAQQRVFAAGSFANFLLAGVSVFLLFSLASAVFTTQGVAFGSYAASSVPVSALLAINGQPVPAGGLSATVAGMPNETLVEFTAGNATYFAYPPLIIEQAGKQNIILYDDAGAVKAKLEGVITSVDGTPVKTPMDLRNALVAAGPGQGVTITTLNNSQTLTFAVETKPEIAPKFHPDLSMDIGLWFEQYIPGTVEFANAASGFSASLLGQPKMVNWQTIQVDKQFWQYAAEKYPALADRAGQKIAALTAMESQYPQAGFIGISFVAEHRELFPQYKPVEGIILFIVGLLAFLFIINFGVGAFNMLPIGGIGLDGYRMWQLVVRKVSKRR